jgi:hypothetical protein
MTEQEWLACNDPTAMLEFLRDKASERKLRLFAVGCVRQLKLSDIDERIGQVIQTSEEYADGNAEWNELLGARKLANAVFKDALAHRGLPGLGAGAVQHAGATAHPSANVAAHRVANIHLAATSLRDIFGNPFRPIALDSAWLTPKVVALAQAIYDDRAFDRMPELAAALEEAGCTNADILDHCRQPGEHVRGCWVVDLLLAKE